MLNEGANNRRALNPHPGTLGHLMRALLRERVNRESDNERDDDTRDTSANNIDGVFVPSIRAWISGVFLMSVTHVSLSLTGCGKPRLMPTIWLEFSVRRERQNHVRMLKKAVQQGRSERRGEEVRSALRVCRSPFELILANGKSPPVIPISERLASIR
jgi:hypothetical protein